MLLYGDFQDRGYTFEAHIPNSDAEPVAFELRVLVNAESKYVLLVPMLYTPTFGVDVGDTQKLEAILEQMLALLPEAHNFSNKEIEALDKLEAMIGGKELRERHQQPRNTSPTGGQFEYTDELFANRFADILGGPEAMSQWMKSTVPQLGDRTPEDALRLGMADEVVTYLMQLVDRQAHPGSSA
jgi:Protein of unknown function (DUF2384)